MQGQHSHWLPRIGQRVRVKESGHQCTVEEIEGTGAHQRFILRLDPTRTGPRAVPGRRTTYRLEELEPPI